MACEVKKGDRFIIYLFIFWLGITKTIAQDTICVQNLSPQIVAQILEKAEMYEKKIKRFEASAYIKVHFHIEKHNQIIRLLPSMFHVDPEEKNYLVETYDSIRYLAPDVYDAKVIAAYGSTKGFDKLSTELLRNLRLNIYSAYVLPDKLISPLAPNATKYYNYKLRSKIKENDYQIYEVQVVPKYKNTQLLSGVFWFNSKDWSVRSLYATGTYDLVNFSVHINMGRSAKNKYLPEWMNGDLIFKFLGNTINAHCSSTFSFSNIELASSIDLSRRKKRKTDLSDMYQLTVQPKIKSMDSLKIARHRTEPLTSLEQAIYQKKVTKELKDSYLKRYQKTNVSKFWDKMEGFFLRSHTVDAIQFDSRIKFSPLINPVLFSYSGSRGISYRQEFRFDKYFRNQKRLQIKPQIGYNFKFKEFYWRLYSSYNYELKHEAYFSFEVGNGSRIYNNSIFDDLNNEFNNGNKFGKIQLLYYTDLYGKLYHNIEIFNGFIASCGFTTHYRSPKIKSSFDLLNPPSYEDLIFLKKIKEKYITFAPSIKLKWTPGQYYYIYNKRKKRLYSEYPTFSFLWERCFNGFLGSTGEYEQLEFDVQQSFKLGAMNSFYYRFGAGLYTDQASTYFVDYINLSQNNLPNGWNDDISGEFQLLNRKWYNASSYYLRGNLTYESPLLFLHRFFRNTNLIQKERLYVNALTVESLHPYIEVGYAVCTHLLDIAVFSNYMDGKFYKLGLKFTIELFNK